MRPLLITILALLNFCALAQKVDADKQLRLAVQQYKGLLREFKDPSLFPQSLLPDSSYRKMKSEWWCSGFFGGSLWFLADYTQDKNLKAAAEKWTLAVEKEQFNTSTHDLGFMLYCPYGNALRFTKDQKYKQPLLQGAESLSSRFNPAVGQIKSWDSFKGGYKYPVIIDNMMNLEYLFWAAKVSGNKKYYNISITHADKTMANHFRPDNSSYHVVCYDEQGNVLERKTAQGAADDSAWSRGQAWGLYGYTVMYRETRDKKYLDQAHKIAAFYMNHPNLPKDKVPYWDFNAPNIPNEPRDASAAAVAASGLLELSHYSTAGQAKKYQDFAEATLYSLSSPAYFAKEGNQHFLLRHSVGSIPHNMEIDVPLIYADYYYIEALLRYKGLAKKRL